MRGSKTMDLTEFLLARIADRESEILNGWDSDGRARIASMWTGSQPGYTTVASDHADDCWIADGREVENARHVRVIFDPARDLARCAADRRIIERCRPTYAILYRESERLLAEAFDQTTVKTVAHSGPIWPFAEAEATLRELATVYADHQDYLEEWKP